MYSRELRMHVNVYVYAHDRYLLQWQRFVAMIKICCRYCRSAVDISRFLHKFFCVLTRIYIKMHVHMRIMERITLQYVVVGIVDIWMDMSLNYRILNRDSCVFKFIYAWKGWGSGGRKGIRTRGWRKHGEEGEPMKTLLGGGCCTFNTALFWHVPFSPQNYGMATISRLLNIIGLFCRIQSLL